MSASDDRQRVASIANAPAYVLCKSCGLIRVEAQPADQGTCPLCRNAEWAWIGTDATIQSRDDTKRSAVRLVNPESRHAAMIAHVDPGPMATAGRVEARIIVDAATGERLTNSGSVEWHLHYGHADWPFVTVEFYSDATDRWPTWIAECCQSLNGRPLVSWRNYANLPNLEQMIADFESMARYS